MPHSQTVQSIDRALDVLEAVVAAGSGGLTLQRLSELAELKTTTTFNLARTLVERGYLRKGAGRPVVYRAGERLGWVASRVEAEPDHPLDEPLMRLAQEFAGWRFIFAEARGPDVFQTDAVQGGDQAVAHGVDRWMAPYVSASSLCHLAFWSREERGAFEAVYPFGLYGAGLWERPEDLSRFLEEVRASGLVLMREIKPERLAAPVFNRRGEFVGSLGTSRIHPRKPGLPEVRRLAEGLRREAGTISERLGSHRPTGIRTQPITT